MRFVFQQLHIFCISCITRMPYHCYIIGTLANVFQKPFKMVSVYNTVWLETMDILIQLSIKVH